MIKVLLTQAQIERIIKALRNDYMQISDQHLIDFLLSVKEGDKGLGNEQLVYYPSLTSLSPGLADSTPT